MEDSKKILDKLEKLSDDIASMKNDIAEIKQCNIDMSTKTEEICNKIKNIDNKLFEKDCEIKKLKGEVLNLKDQVFKTNERVLKIESQSRRNNLILSGIAEVSGETSENCKDKLLKVLKEKMGIVKTKEDIVRCHRLYSKRSNGPRPIIAKFYSYDVKQDIWSNRKKLGDYVVGGKQVYNLQEDFPDEYVRRRRVLWPAIKAARDFYNVDRMVLKEAGKEDSSRMYSYDQLDDLPPVINPKLINTKSNGSSFAFQSSLCPLSNLFSVQFKVDNLIYTSSEQYYQHQRALLHGDDILAYRIPASENSRDAMTLGKKLSDEPHRESRLKSIMKKGLMAKFALSNMNDFLLMTGSQHLIQAGNDRVWGCGRDLNNPSVLNANNFEGKNLLGDLLMEIRHQ